MAVYKTHSYILEQIDAIWWRVQIDGDDQVWYEFEAYTLAEAERKVKEMIDEFWS